MIDFAKGFANRNGIYIEGYLSNKDQFNGVLFLLKEPNADDQTSFWFKDSINGIAENDSTSKRTFTKYKNTFELLLSYTNRKLELINCAYANILSYKGERTESEDYRSLSVENKLDRFFNLINECNPTYVFVCRDMFEALLQSNKLVDANNCGVEYKKGFKRSASVLEMGIKVFEINHPSYWGGGYPLEKQQ